MMSIPSEMPTNIRATTSLEQLINRHIYTSANSFSKESET